MYGTCGLALTTPVLVSKLNSSTVLLLSPQHFTVAGQGQPLAVGRYLHLPAVAHR